MPIHLEDRTEPATPRRRQEARNKGQVARSHDLTAAVMLIGGLLALWLLGPRLFNALLGIVAGGIQPSTANLVDSLEFAKAAGRQAALAVAPVVLAAAALGVAALFTQVGPLATLQPLMPSLSKISPLSGVRRLFSVRSLVTTLLNIGKLLLIAAVVWISTFSDVAAILFSSVYGPGELLQLGGWLVFELCMQIAAVLLVLAILDYVWQRYRHNRELMMTREEVRDELRSMEGDPVIRRRRRQLQMQIAMQRLRKDVPTADVVVTNPTHIAVAVRYDCETMIAPKVVAKGADQVAIRIRQIAAEHSIPIVERRPLARALYETVEIGQYIPERFYKAIAEVLAYIYELTGRSAKAGRSALAAVR